MKGKNWLYAVRNKTLFLTTVTGSFWVIEVLPSYIRRRMARRPWRS